jgi:NitT/TauT family transport system substrate-binding protein
MRHSTRAKRPRLALLTGALLAAATLALTSCASGSSGGGTGGSTSSAAPVKMTDVTLTLNFLAGAPNAGFMVAKEKGYYADAGLNVKIQEGQGSGTTASLVAGGNSQFGYADAPSAMAVTSQGGDLQVIAPVLQTNGFSVMSLKDKKIKTIKDLKGKSVALQPGTAQASLFEAVLAVNGVDKSSVNIVNIDPSALVASLLQGSVDSITAGADNQGVQLRQQGADLNEILYRDAGVPTVGLSMIVQPSYAKENPEVVKAFVAASLKGWDDARKDIPGAAATVVKQFPAGANEDAVKAQFEVDAKLLCAPGSDGLGSVPEKNWATTYDLLTKYVALPTTEPVTSYYTTDYLPKELPKC